MIPKLYGQKATRIGAKWTHCQDCQARTDGETYEALGFSSVIISVNVIPYETNKPSVVGRERSELTTRRLVILVICCIIILPFLDGSVDGYENAHRYYGLQELHDLSQRASIMRGDFRPFSHPDFFAEKLRQYARDTGRLLYLEIAQQECNHIIPTPIILEWLRQTKFQPMGNPYAPFTEAKSDTTGWIPATDLRSSPSEVFKSFRNLTELDFIEVMDETGCTSRAYFDTSDISRTTAALSLSKTIFVMLLLVSFSIVFSNDAQALVVSPVERMMSVVSNLADNPLAALDNGASEESHISGDLYDDDAVETAILENILRKIGSLLQVGFGPAGASIIAKNIGHGELRALEPGRMVTSVFGFVCIKDFTSIVACLEEDMTRYVNAIAAIVHRGVHHGFGAANKNIGSSFLFAWKICDGLLTSPQQCSGFLRSST